MSPIDGDDDAAQRDIKYSIKYSFIHWPYLYLSIRNAITPNATDLQDLQNRN